MCEKSLFTLEFNIQFFSLLVMEVLIHKKHFLLGKNYRYINGFSPFWWDFSPRRYPRSSAGFGGIFKSQKVDIARRIPGLG